MTLVYISLGSNVGSRETEIASALRRIEGSGIRILRRSSLYETEPRDFVHQPWFLNQVVEGQTHLAPEALLELLLAIEREGGRDRTSAPPRGPRTIDLDVLLYGEAVIETPALSVPHPRLHERRFVLDPLLELRPDLVHPGTRKMLSSYLDAVRTQQVRRI